MKIFLEKAIFINRAPFDNLQIEFSQNEIAVLSATNGRGKTTILSHIVDALHEIARPYFPQEFIGKENKYYRLSSSIFNLNQTTPSFVYFRFRINEDILDYIDIRGICTEEQYNNNILLEDKILFNNFIEELTQNGNIKKTSENLSKKIAEGIFKNNLLTYFPAYRYEVPGYLNDTYKVSLSFRKESGYSGQLINPLEVSTGLNSLMNWVMDIVLDLRISGDSTAGKMISHLNEIISKTLISKKFGNVNFGVGQRGLGGSRLQIGTQHPTLGFSMIYPSVFNLSSGELSVFCLFSELLKQFDNIRKNAGLEEISGIVIIDEVDKHLHIKLQNETLPSLFQLFPNLQFIISSHSPFLSMGLADKAKTRSKIIDLDNFGISTDPTTNDLYQEVYNMMIKENDKFKEKYESLTIATQEKDIPLIITEGKTDWKYFITALKYFHAKEEFINIKSDFFLKFGSKTDQRDLTCGTNIELEMGDSDLEKYLNALILTREKDLNSSKQIRIGIFDSDNKNIKLISEEKTKFNIHSFKIEPEGISTEFLFSDNEIKSEIQEKRLFIGSEFNQISKKLIQDKTINIGGDNTNLNKAGKKIIIDCDVFDQNEKKISITKEKFSQAIFNNEIKISDESWENFRHIFERIEKIISPTFENS